MKRLTMLALISLLSIYSGGCTGMSSRTGQEADFNDIVQGFVGEDVRILEQSWGSPDRYFTQPDGTKVYGYVTAKRSGMYSELEPPGLMRYPPHLEDPVTVGDVTYEDRFGWCMTYFVMDEAGRIEKVIWTGRCGSGRSAW